MKRIAMSLFTIFAMVAVVAGGTFAAFQGTATIIGNTVGVATVALDVTNAAGFGSLSKPIVASNLLPGDFTNTHRAVLTNTSTVAVDITMYATRTSAAGTCSDIDLEVEIFHPSGVGEFSAVIYSGPVNGLFGAGNAVPVLTGVAADYQISVHQQAQLRLSASNPGVTCTWDETFVAVPAA